MIGSVYHHLEYQESPMGEVTEEVDAPKMNVTDADKKMNTTAYKRMKAGDPRYNDKTTKDVKEAKDTHCSDKCCGADVKREDCKCPPTCKHCNCNAVSESADRSLKKHAETLNKHIPDNKRSEEFVKIMATKYAAKYSIDADDLFDTYNAMFSLHQGGSPFLKKETYKESLAAKLENVQQQRKDDMFKSMSDAGAYSGKSDGKQNKKSKPVKRSQADKDAGVAKMRDEDEAAKKAQRDRFAAIKKSADNKGK
jgi:hypothetical protein